LPIVIAYRVPVVIHEELYDLYKDYLTAMATTHNDQPHTFISAMNLFLDKLDQLKEDEKRAKRESDTIAHV